MHESWLSNAFLLAGAVPSLVAAQSPKTHKLPATPATVAYGHYWSQTPPVLRIASGDIINTPLLDKRPSPPPTEKRQQMLTMIPEALQITRRTLDWYRSVPGGPPRCVSTDTDATHCGGCDAPR